MTDNPYYPDLCRDIHEEILEMSKRGHLLIEIMAFIADKIRERRPDFKMSKEKFRTWRKLDPELEETLQLADIYREKWWVKECRTSLKDQKFNTTAWYIMMKNCFQWGDRPSERTFSLKEWGGTIDQKIKQADQLFAEGEIALEQYLLIMKSLHYHATVNEIIVVHPVYASIQLEMRFNSGEITKDEYNHQKKLLEWSQLAREVAAEQIARETKVLSKFDKPQQKIKRKKSKEDEKEEETMVEEVRKRMDKKLKKMKIVEDYNRDGQK